MKGSAALIILGLTGAALQASAANVFFEDFQGVSPSNAGYGSGVIGGSSFEVLSGPVWAATSDHGRFLDLAAGWYAWNYDSTANIGTASVQSVPKFDLVASTTYTLTFEYSRQGFSAGNGPFPAWIKASVDNNTVTYDEVVGFYFGETWRTGSLTWTQAVDAFGVPIVFIAGGPGGYAGMDIDTISLNAVANVPVPAAAWLFGSGLLGLAGIARRKTAIVSC